MQTADLDRHSKFNMSMQFLNMISMELEQADYELMNVRNDPYRAYPLLNYLEVLFLKVVSLMKKEDRENFLTRLDNARECVKKELKMIETQNVENEEEEGNQWRKTISQTTYVELRALYLDLMDVINKHSLGLMSEIRNDESKESRFKKGLKLGGIG